nr:helix-turn-helix domain-containing protein [Falsiruegeria litorea]
MSWAFAQGGLKPATKLVLVYLADCHNAHTRQCDPSQQTLAEQCCMARSTVNQHLNILERERLIERIQRSDKKTKQQNRTFYILGFEQHSGQDVEKAVSGNRTRGSQKAVSGKQAKAVSGNAKAVSGKQAKPCPENGQSRVRTVGHEPEYNLKKPEGARGGTCARTREAKPFFTDSERSEANAIADHLASGGQVRFQAVLGRVLECLIAEKMLSEAQTLLCQETLDERG